MATLQRRKVLVVVVWCAIILSTLFTLHILGAYRKYAGTLSSEREVFDVSSNIEPAATTRVTTNGHQRIAIVQYTGDSKNEAMGYTLARDAMKAYAAKHAYAYYLYQERDVKIDEPDSLILRTLTSHHAWRRPFMLSQIIKEGKHEWIAYFDTDVVVTDPSIPLEQFIDGEPTGKDMIIADDPGGINNGMFFQKATNWSLEFNDIWWNERPLETKNMHDNWPFMAALLVSWGTSSAQSYEGECSMSKNVEMEDWKNFYPCYRTQVERLGSRTSHPEGCTSDFPEPCGSAIVDDPHVKAVWGINSGIGFGGKNAWVESSFVLHLAGKSHEERDKLLRQHADLVLATYMNSTPTETLRTDDSRAEESVLDEQESATALDVQVVTIQSNNGDLIVRRPISFSAPEELWQPVVSYKTHGFAAVIPGNTSTYEFDDEDAYHKSYKHAMFGVTRSKAGWDCMRHIEIMASGCVPYFVDLEKIPTSTMQFYPKDLFRRAKTLEGVTHNGPFLDPNSFSVDNRKLNFAEYYDIATQILEHSRKHLTTRAMAEYVLQTIGYPSPMKALMATSCVDDYLQDSMLHGLKSVLGTKLVDFVPESVGLAREGHCVLDASKGDASLPDYRLNMYMDSWAAESEVNFRSRQGYGKGFTIWNRLSQTLLGGNRNTVLDHVRGNKYDVVFLSYRMFGGPQNSFLDLIRENVPRERVVVFVGGDGPASKSALEEYHGIGLWIFEREIAA